MNIDKDNVVNFLTPTKLVQGTMKGRPRNNLNDSRHSGSNSRQKQEYPSDANPMPGFQNERGQSQLIKSREQAEGRYQIEERSRVKDLGDKDYILNGTSKTVLKSEDNFKLLVDDKRDLKSDSPQRSLFQLHQVEQTVVAPVGEVLAKINNSQRNSRVEQSRLGNSRADPSRREDMEKLNENKSRPKQEFAGFKTENQNAFKWQSSMNDLGQMMNVLKGVRDSIDTSLLQLQQLLDNTSKYLSQINEQFGRIKQRILDYTARVLDASFTRYKENMINWIKYEDIEKKAIALRGQLDKTIRQDELIVREMNKSTKASRVALGKQQEIQQKIQFYAHLATEIQTAKEECQNMHPQLKRQRVLAFEQALNEMADF